MIYCISGRPRSGKSYESVVFHIIPAIKSGRKVITNVTLNIDWFVKLFGPEVKSLIQIVDGQLNEFGKMNRPFSCITDYMTDWRDDQNRGPLFVIDEAHMVLPTRLNDAKILEFYSLHGHYGLDIILLTQNLRKLHRDIKDMIEMTYYCAKNTAFGSDKTYTKKVRIGATTEVVNEEIRKYKEHYFPAYKSHTQSSGSVAEAMANDIKPIWKRWPFYCAAIFLVIGPAILIYASLSKDEPKAVQAKNQVKSQVQSQASDVSVLDDSQQTVQVRESRTSRRKVDFGPLGAYELYATGSASQVAFVLSSGRYDINPSKTFTNVYISAYSKSSKLFTIEHHELYRMGYDFKELADCVYKATWNDESRIITCVNEDEIFLDVNNPLSSVPVVSI